MNKEIQEIILGIIIITIGSTVFYGNPMEYVFAAIGGVLIGNGMYYVCKPK